MPAPGDREETAVARGRLLLPLSGTALCPLLLQRLEVGHLERFELIGGELPFDGVVEPAPGLGLVSLQGVGAGEVEAVRGVVDPAGIVAVQDADRLLQVADRLVVIPLAGEDHAAGVEQAGIVFLDEIDKVCGPESKHGPDVSRQGVQRDLLPIVEGSTVMTKYGPVKTDHVLFIAAGAFHSSKPSDLMPELHFPLGYPLALVLMVISAVLPYLFFKRKGWL